VLFKIYEKEQEGVEWPLTDQHFAEARTVCPGWKQALSSLSKKDLIKQSHGLTLTGSGREEAGTPKHELEGESPRIDPGLFLSNE
jgi:hypothetical protein